MDQTELIKYWISSSDSDFSTMNHLHRNEDFHWALFIGHLVIEKLLKACYVKNIDINHPFTHNLLQLAEKSRIELTEDQKDFLITVTTFNIQARYDDYKLAFYKTCTKEYTKEWIEKIKDFREWIKRQLLK
jgi:HEPN domain-containing protein